MIEISNKDLINICDNLSFIADCSFKINFREIITIYKNGEKIFQTDEKSEAKRYLIEILHKIKKGLSF